MRRRIGFLHACGLAALVLIIAAFTLAPLVFAQAPPDRFAMVGLPTFHAWWFALAVAVLALVLFLLLPEGRRSIWIHSVLAGVGALAGILAPEVNDWLAWDWSAVLPPAQVGVVMFAGHAIAAALRLASRGPVK